MNKFERIQKVLDALQKTSFMRMPSFSHTTLTQRGGLFQDSMKYWVELERITEKMGLKWEHPSSPFVIAVIRNACDIDRYFYNYDYHCWEDSNKLPKRSSCLSLEIAESLGIELTAEEKACIRYLGSEMSNEERRNAFDQYPRQMWLLMVWAQYAEIENRLSYEGKSNDNNTDAGNNP